MSTIISYDEDSGKQIIRIYAPDSRTAIHRVDMENTIIEITSEAETPFITCSRFRGCRIRAPNMRAFADCYFDDKCEMDIGVFPKVAHNQSNAETINRNRVSVSLMTNFCGEES